MKTKDQITQKLTPEKKKKLRQIREQKESKKQ